MMHKAKAIGIAARWNDMMAMNSTVSVIDVLALNDMKVPPYKKRDAKAIARRTRTVTVRLMALSRAKNQQEWRDLRSALNYDMRELEIMLQTL